MIDDILMGLIMLIINYRVSSIQYRESMFINIHGENQATREQRQI